MIAGRESRATFVLRAQRLSVGRVCDPTRAQEEAQPGH